MQQCCHCNETAKHSDAKGRLFCSPDAQRIYYGAWSTILAHVDRQRLVALLDKGGFKQPFYQFGMKRTLSVESFDDPATLSLLEKLPNEILGEILHWAFRGVEDDIAKMRALFRVREGSIRLREIIKGVIFASIRQLDVHVVDEIGDDGFRHFPNLEKLELTLSIS